MSESVDLQSLQQPSAYRSARGQVFRSDESLRWFMRVNHDELVKEGALVVLAGHRLINAPAFDRVALQLGQRRASRG